MLFLDGSPHAWFGEEKTTLLLSTDDSTGKPLYGLFRKEEDLEGCFGVCKEVFARFGRPSVFYLDRASQFKTTRHKSDSVEPTQFQRAMSELGIRLIFAHSAQAKEEARGSTGPSRTGLSLSFGLRISPTAKGRRSI